MPRLPLKLCGHAGCRTPAAGGRCPKHPAPKPRSGGWVKPDDKAGSASKRGYGRAWQAKRKYVMARDPICKVCGREPSSHVDHIVPKYMGGTDDYSNLRGIGRVCHGRKSSTEGHDAKRAAQAARGLPTANGRARGGAGRNRGANVRYSPGTARQSPR